MKSLHPLIRSIAVACLACSICSTPPVVSQEIGSNAKQSSDTGAYPNTAYGLRSFLNDLLLAAKSGDESKLWSKISEMEIPNYEAWYVRTLGQEKGQASAGQYGKLRKMTELQFEMLWTELAKQEGEISVEKVDTTKKYEESVDEYKADWKKTDTSLGPDRQPIGLFDFVDGKFRLREFVHAVQIIAKAGTPVPPRIDNVVPAKLINRIQPVYPDAARQMRIQGMVALNVIVHKDGTVTVQNVGAGHPLLAPAAVEAVQQWRYQATTVNGDPFDVQTKVYVTFELSKPQSEQKQ